MTRYRKESGEGECGGLIKHEVVIGWYLGLPFRKEKEEHNHGGQCEHYGHKLGVEAKGRIGAETLPRQLHHCNKGGPIRGATWHRQIWNNTGKQHMAKASCVSLQLYFFMCHGSKDRCCRVKIAIYYGLLLELTIISEACEYYITNKVYIYSYTYTCTYTYTHDLCQCWPDECRIVSKSVHVYERKYVIVNILLFWTYRSCLNTYICLLI